jgi:hypothetical protein
MAELIVFYESYQLSYIIDRTWLMAVMFVIAAILPVLIPQITGTSQRLSGVNDKLYSIFAGSVVLVVVFYVVVFSRLAHATFNMISNNEIHDAGYVYRSSVNITELLQNINEYQVVPGFEMKKERLRTYYEQIEKVSRIQGK